MNIKKLRTKRGLSQSGLAKKVGVSLPTIQSWELGVSNPNSNNFVKLVAVLEGLTGVVTPRYTKSIRDEMDRLVKNKKQYLLDFTEEMARLKCVAEYGETTTQECEYGKGIFTSQGRKTILRKGKENLYFNSRAEAGRFVGARACDVAKAISRGGFIKGYVALDGEKNA